MMTIAKWAVLTLFLVIGLITLALLWFENGAVLWQAHKQGSPLAHFLPGYTVSGDIDTFEGVWLGTYKESIALGTLSGVILLPATDTTLYWTSDTCSKPVQSLNIKYGSMQQLTSKLTSEQWAKYIHRKNLVQVKYNVATKLIESVSSVQQLTYLLNGGTNNACY